MAEKSQPGFSSLELVRHDAIANAPEHDRSADAPEVDHMNDGPQLAYTSVPQAASSNLLPTPVGVMTEKETDVQQSTKAPRSRVCRLPRKTWIILAILAIILVVAIGVGSGVGIRSRQAASSSATSTLPSLSANTTVLPTSTGIPLLQQVILNDTSFAAITAVDGNRHVFFQDIDGNLRHSVYSSSKQGWIANSTLISTNILKARAHTPLSAVSAPINSNNSNQIYLLYIAANNSLAVTAYGYGFWSDLTADVNPSSFRAAPDSRALTLTIIPNTENIEILANFVDLDGIVRAIHGFTRTDGSWITKDITAILTSSLPVSNIPIEAPFTTVKEVVNDITLIYFVFYSRQGLSQAPAPSILNLLYSNESFSSLRGSVCAISAPHDIDIVEAGAYVAPSNFAAYLLYVNGTALLGSRSSAPAIGVPSSPFPYTRLATTTPVNSSVFYLYHQIDSSTFAEDTFDVNIGTWTSSNITVTLS